MRSPLAAAIACVSLLSALPAVSVPATAQMISVQYDDGYGRTYDDPYRDDDDPYYDRGRYGRDDGYRSYDRRDDRYDDYDDGQRYEEHRYQPQRRDQRRFLNDGQQRDVVVKRLSKQDKRCLKKHSTYDPEIGTYSDGRGGQKRCRG